MRDHGNAQHLVEQLVRTLVAQRAGQLAGRPFVFVDGDKGDAADRVVEARMRHAAAAHHRHAQTVVDLRHRNRRPPVVWLVARTGDLQFAGKGLEELGAQQFQFLAGAPGRVSAVLGHDAVVLAVDRRQFGLVRCVTDMGERGRQQKAKDEKDTHG